MPTDVIKFFDDWKGFGFVAPDEPGPDAYLSRFALNAVQIQGVKARGSPPTESLRPLRNNCTWCES